jgi:hypothetical protein
MTRSAGPLFACAIALVSTQANAQAGAIPPVAAGQEAQPSEPQSPAAGLVHATLWAKPLSLNDARGFLGFDARWLLTHCRVCEMAVI